MKNLYAHTQMCTVNEETYMLTVLDKHNDYFTLMMLIIDTTVKLNCSLDCDISLMDVIKKIREKH